MGVLSNELSNESECSVKVMGDIVELEINGRVICKSIQLWHNLALRELFEQRAAESKDIQPVITEDRFEQLAEQASFNIYRSDLWRGTANRFAELIVQECVGIVADAVDHREPASTYVDKIKRRFGID
jgi:hypothetical protein